MTPSPGNSGPAAARAPRPVARVLAGQKALLTGASCGIGRAVALALGAAGADVVVNYVTAADPAEEVAAAIRAGGAAAYTAQADVSREDEVHTMFAAMIERFGTIDILINNAGLQRDAAFHEMTLAQWSEVIAVNLTGQFLCAREAIREFLRRGIVAAVSSAAGQTICMSSLHQVIPWSSHANYAPSKGGVMLMMQTLAHDVAPNPPPPNLLPP